jgi:Zn ribbon nucleic-acid-binding protein
MSTSTFSASVTIASPKLHLHIQERTHLDVESARCVVKMMRTEVAFQVGSGARCPLCGSFAGTRAGAPNGIRYHTCPECGHGFRSVYADL